MEATKAPWLEAKNLSGNPILPPPAAPTRPPPSGSVPISGGFGRPFGSLSTSSGPSLSITVEPAMPPQIESNAMQRDLKPASKQILSVDDLNRFLRGNSLKSYLSFLLFLSDSVKGKKASTDLLTSTSGSSITRLSEALSKLSSMVDEIPPAAQSLRYGNPSFKTWLLTVADQAIPMLQGILGDDLASYSQQLAPYWLESFGNGTRIDYGTGHETNFAAFLYCLARLGLVDESDCEALVLVVFKRYLDLMRKIQTTYWLEPAGSHGVWGLDDYQILPFFWGASQLNSHPMIKPKSINNEDIIEAYHEQYLYLGCVRFVKQVKKGPLHETSPMLNDISAVPTWAKVASGLMKMYQVEVLSKFPIMQHFYTCGLFTLD